MVQDCKCFTHFIYIGNVARVLSYRHRPSKASKAFIQYISSNAAGQTPCITHILVYIPHQTHAIWQSIYILFCVGVFFLLSPIASSSAKTKRQVLSRSTVVYSIMSRPHVPCGQRRSIYIIAPHELVMTSHIYSTREMMAVASGKYYDVPFGSIYEWFATRIKLGRYKVAYYILQSQMCGWWESAGDLVSRLYVAMLS